MEAHKELELRWAEFNGLDPAGMVSCSSGTAALHLALAALRLPQGCEVLVPDLCMVAVPRAVVVAGLTPVFIDCGDDLNILLDPADKYLEARAVLAEGGAAGEFFADPAYFVHAAVLVHTYGRRCDPAPWHERFGPWVHIVEDLAEAHGIRPHPQTSAACWSHYKNKAVAGQEGGTVWFRHPEHAQLARQLRCQGFTDAHDFWHTPGGWNHRLADLLAEEILRSLRLYHAPGVKPSTGRIYNSVPEARREVESWYDEYCPAEWRMPKRDAIWCYDLRIPGLTWERQAELVGTLDKEGIAARQCFKPNHRQREWIGDRRVRYVGSGNSVKCSQETFYLPVRPHIAESDCRRAFDILRAANEKTPPSR